MSRRKKKAIKTAETETALSITLGELKDQYLELSSILSGLNDDGQ